MISFVVLVHYVALPYFPWQFRLFGVLSLKVFFLILDIFLHSFSPSSPWFFFVSDIQYRERPKKKKRKMNEVFFFFFLIESRAQLCSPWLNTGLCHPQSRTLADQNCTDCHLLPQWQIGDRYWGSRGMSGLVELWDLKFTLDT